MKYTVYHFRRVQGTWFNHGARDFAATKREAARKQRFIDADNAHVVFLSDKAPESVGCAPGGLFPAGVTAV